MNRKLIAALVAATALLVPATIAQAATVSLENGAIAYRGEGAEGIHLLVSTYEDYATNQTYMSLHDSGADRQLITSGPCFMTTGYDPTPLCPLDPSQPLRVYGSAGNDDIGIFSSEVPDAKSIAIDGGAGNDTIEDAYDSKAGRVLNGGPGKDDIKGYAGDDRIDGGDGDDLVDGGEGDDQVRGGAGNDVMWGDHYKDPGADLLDGGPGIDTTHEWGIPSDLDLQPRATVTLDGIADDGRPGEGDNVIGIERIDVTVVGDYTGTDGPETIKVSNPGNTGPSTLRGRGGDDILQADDDDDTVDGGAGNDIVEGGRGNDTVTGGPGRDTIYGDATAAHCGSFSCQIPFGNDVIYARDGEADTIDCGIGTDTAIVDPIDIVANCETVQGSGGGGNTGPGGSVPVSVAGRLSVRSIAAKGLKLSVRCPTACSVDGAIAIDRRSARKLGLGRKTTVGGGSARADRAGTATAKLRLKGKAKGGFKRLRKATLTVRVTVQLTSGPAQTSTRKLTLKR